MVEPKDPVRARDPVASAAAQEHVLLVRARSWICALPITSAVETMRALPIRPVDGAPPFIRGLSIIRGAVLPVVCLAALLGASQMESGPGRRFITVRAGDRKLALEVDEVLGARLVDTVALATTPPLLVEALPDPVEKIGVLDRQVLALLGAARLIPDALWSSLMTQRAT